MENTELEEILEKLLSFFLFCTFSFFNFGFKIGINVCILRGLNFCKYLSLLVLF